MLTLLAQAMPPPELLSEWIQVAMYLVGTAAAVVGLLVGLKVLRRPVGFPQPLEIKAHNAYATAVEMQALQQDMDQLRDEVRSGFNKLGDERRVSVANLHSKVDEANRKVDGLGGELKILNQQVAQILSRMLKA
jgi:hypothetical protein